MSVRRATQLSILMVISLGCGSDDATDADGASDEGLHTTGEATGAICPPGSTLSYDGFGRDFMAAYCTGCHASTLTNEVERSGAPDDHNYDSLQGIQAMLEHVEHVAAAGPDAVNEIMPLRVPKPSDEERLQLGEWLACGAPK